MVSDETIFKPRKEEYLRSIRDGSVELLEKALLDLPFLKSGGHALELTATELPRFQSQKISTPGVCSALSFEALLHFFETTIKVNQNDIHYPLTFLFINDSKRASEYVLDLMKRDESMKSEILSSMKNLLRWIDEGNIETRWSNPLHALQKSKAAMKRVSAAT